MQAVILIVVVSLQGGKAGRRADGRPSARVSFCRLKDDLTETCLCVLPRVGKVVGRL